MSQGFHGLVQRLVQKEKQVLQLQTELDKFKAQNPGESREAVSPNFEHILALPSNGMLGRASEAGKGQNQVEYLDGGNSQAQA